jgi:hypothetical protein
MTSAVFCDAHVEHWNFSRRATRPNHTAIPTRRSNEEITHHKSFKYQYHEDIDISTLGRVLIMEIGQGKICYQHISNQTESNADQTQRDHL